MKLSTIASAVKITLDKERTLILDFNAFAEYADVMKTEELPDVIAGMFSTTEKDANGFPVMSKPMTSKQIRAAIWAGLQHEDKPPSVKEVGRHISRLNTSDLIGAVLKSYLGLEDAEPADPTSPAVETKESEAAGTGQEHGLSLVTS